MGAYRVGAQQRDPIAECSADLNQSLAWAKTAFGDAGVADGGISVSLRRQDFATLHFGQSCIGTPIKIGSQKFEHGLGTHANSEIVVGVPAKAKAFKALVGIDNNHDTQGTRGSARFEVEIAGKGVVSTGVLKGGDQPYAIDVHLPADAKELVLKVGTTEDGPAHDQADWADACFVMADGSLKYIDEGRSSALLAETTAPFSFSYGGKASSELIEDWQRKTKTSELKDRVRYTVSWTDPKTGLMVTAEAMAFKDFPAVEWLLHFENTGNADTPILSDVQAANVTLATGDAKTAAVIHRVMGDDCSERSFTPFESTLPAGANVSMAAVNGRPSQGTGFPFWNFQYGDQGTIAAIGWSGQWAAQYARSQDGATRFTAGMEKTHTVLHPGEKIRTPRVLMMLWSGDRVDAQNRFRRLMLAKYVPQEDGKPKRLPVFLQCFDRYVRAVPEWATEAGQLKGIRTAKELGFDGFWFDAAWFPGGFPSGVGNWFADPQKFPNGLKPLGDLCKQLGLEFVLWFEPCRVGDDSEISHEHADWVYGGAKGGLFNLGNPDARRWMTDRLSKLISEWGVTCYREDFNIDPLGYWRADEPEDRQGINEIRFVEGHYAMWDELRAKHPGLWIDNCASGGRRIDLETVMRAVPLWRSDIGCWATEPAWHQMEVMAISHYVPISSCAAWEPVPYQARSTAAAGLQLTLGYLDKNFDAAAAKRVVAEAQENRKYWYGDLYNLTPVNSRLDNFAAYQLHLAGSNEGMVMAFRRAESGWVGIIPALRGLNPRTTYQLEFVDEAFKKTTSKATGKELMESGLTLRIPNEAASLMVRYKPAAK